MQILAIKGSIQFQNYKKQSVYVVSVLCAMFLICHYRVRINPLKQLYNIGHFPGYEVSFFSYL